MVVNIVLSGLFLFGIVSIIVSYIKGHDYICGFGCGIITTCIVAYATYRIEPNALEVYQGKTTMQYTIVDGVKVDSCVVYKENTNFITIEVQ